MFRWHFYTSEEGWSLNFMVKQQLSQLILVASISLLEEFRLAPISTDFTKKIIENSPLASVFEHGINSKHTTSWHKTLNLKAYPH